MSIDTAIWRAIKQGLGNELAIGAGNNEIRLLINDKSIVILDPFRLEDIDAMGNSYFLDFGIGKLLLSSDFLISLCNNANNIVIGIQQSF